MGTDVKSIELFPYQESTINFLCRDQTDLYKEVHLTNFADDAGTIRVQMAAAKKGRGVIYADMGLGKTLIALKTYHKLCPDSPLLVVCTKRAFNTWRRELVKWGFAQESDIQFISGTPSKRKHMWETSHPIKIVSYATAQRDQTYIQHFIQRQSVEMIIFDEAQNMRNRKTNNYILGRTLCQRVPQVLFLSGTLITRGPQDLWTYMHMCDPKRFKSYWNFIHAFCIIVETQFGQEIAGPKNTKSLAKELARHVVRLRENDPEVVDARPPLTRDVIPIDPTAEQRKLHDQLVSDLYITLPDNTIQASPNSATAAIKLRQLMVCPKILHPEYGWGASIEYLLDVLTEDPHIVIFTPFRQGVTLMSRAIQDKFGPQQTPLQLMGGSDPGEIRQVEEHFNSLQGQHLPFLCTTNFAESFEVPTARQCFFNGFDWSQLTNYQAEKRLHRLNTPHPINSYYLVGHDTVEESVLHVLNRKQRNTHLTMQDYINVLAERLHKPRR